MVAIWPGDELGPSGQELGYALSSCNSVIARRTFSREEPATWPAVAIIAMTQCPVIARRTAPWQSRLLYDRRWIASFLAMTEQRRSDAIPVIARRAAPWQSRLLCDRRWIASFLAMTRQGRNDAELTITPRAVIARRAAPWQSRPLCDRRWIASFLAMTSQGRNDGAGSQ